jgi:hypothetical protein
MLIPVRSETGYWHELILPHAEIRYLRKLTFEGYDHAANFPCAIVIFTDRIKQSRSRGGRTSSANMSKEERIARAQRAAAARWAV